MKKIILFLAVFGIFGFADTFSQAKMAFESGDYEKAFNLYQKVCNDSNTIGCPRLGYLYSKGLGVKQDKQKAVSLYQKACDSGEATGCFYLGICIMKG